jgi:OOP family OmpA-OmpF porin
MDNLLDLVMRQISSKATGDIARLIGLEPEETGRALQSGLATILGAMAIGASKPGAAENLLKHLTAGGFDTGMFRDLDTLFVGEQATDDFVEAGSNLIASLFGGKQGDVVDTLGPYVNLDQEASHKLLSLVTPLVLSTLGGLVRKGRLNAAGVADLLMGQTAYTGKFLPEGMAVLLGLDELEVPATVGTGADARDGAAEPVGAASDAETGKSGGRSIWPWLLVLALAAIAAAFYFGKDRLRTAATVESPPAATTTTTPATTAPGAVSITLPDGSLIRVAQDSFNAAFALYLAEANPDPDRVFPLEVISFETGSSVLTPVSRAQVEDFRKILAAYPDVTIELIGHTDAVGSEDENLALSIRRAEAGRDALVRAGVAADRITVAGRGATEPIAPNDTEEGRARNRRLELMVTGR